VPVGKKIVCTSPVDVGLRCGTEARGGGAGAAGDVDRELVADVLAAGDAEVAADVAGIDADAVPVQLSGVR